MAQDNIKNLYDALKGEYDLGSEQEFRNSLKDANNRRNLYKAIENDYDLGSEDDFNRSLGYGNVSNATNAGNNSNSTAGSAAQQVVDEYDRTATDNGGRRPAQGGSVDVYMTNRGKVRGVTLPYDSPLRKQYPWLKDVPGDEQIYVDENGDPLYYYADADGRILSKEEAADMDLAADVANTPGRKPRKVPATFIELPGVEISAENRPWRERAGIPEGFGELDINEVPATWQERMQQQQWQSDAMAGEEASRRGDYSKHGIETIKRGNEAAKAREMARNEKWSRMYNVDSPQKAERLKDIETTMKALNGDEKAMNEMQFKTTSMNSQLRDRYDYARMTGKELKDPVLDMTQIGIAPKLERDENGNVVVNENGTPLVGNTTNPVRVNTQKAESERVEREDKERQIKVAEEELKKLIDEARQIESPDYIYMQDAMSPYADPRTTNASLRELSIAIKNKQEQIAGLRRELEGGNKGFIRGFADSLTDLDNITFGLNSLGDNLHTAIVSQQMRNGAKPDKYVEMMLDAMYKNNEVQQRLDENSTRAYRIGGMTGYMLPFMAQITVTGGYSGVAEIGTGLGLRWMERFAAKYGMDTLKKRMAANVIKGLGVGLGDIGAGFVSATTLGLGNTVNDALQRGTGQLGINDKGEYEFTNADDWWRATLKAVTSQTKEFATERFGEHLPGLRRLNVTLAKQGPRVRAISRALSGVTGTPAMRKVAKWLRRGGINGLGAEILEEEIGLPVDVALGDMTWEEAISGKTQGDIILGVPLSVGAMYSVGLGATSLSKGYNTVQYLRYKDRLNNADKTAGFRLTDDVWQPLKSKIDGTTNEGMGTMWDEIRKDDNLSVEEKRAVYDYTTTLMSLRGYNLGMMFNVREAARRKELFVNIKPTGNGQFGDEFDQFKGNAEDAAMFLVTKKGGVAKGVFHRDDVGDIDLAWGNPRGGLEHIIEKHIITYADFDSVESAMGQISDVIKDGKISLQRNGNYAVEKNGVRVILSKAQDGHFVVTAYDNTRNMESKIRSDADATRLRQSIFNNENGTPVSQSTTPGNKDSENFWNSQADAAGNDILSPEERENVHEDGMIHAAVLYPDAQQGSEAQEVFITKGNIVLNADGTIDTEASDKEIYYKGEDGQVHLTSPDKLQSVAQPISVDEYAAANRPEEADVPDAAVEYSPGDVVNVNIGGQTYEATVQGTDGNGNVLVYYQDENDMARPAEFTVDEIRNANRPTGVNIADEHARFVDTGVVSDETVSRIADKIANGQQLTPEEESMRRGAAQRVEDTLKERQASQTQTPVGGSMTTNGVREYFDTTEEAMATVKDVVQNGEFAGTLADGSVQKQKDGFVVTLMPDGNGSVNVTRIERVDERQTTSEESGSATSDEAQAAPATEEKSTTETQQIQPQQGVIPQDAEGNSLYDRAPVEATIADLYDGSLDDNEVQGFIDANIAEAQKKYDSVQKKAPKIGTNKAKYLADKAAWQEKVNEAKRVLDYWKDVNTQKESLTHTTPQEIEAAQAELSGQAAREEYAAMNENVPANPVAVASGFIRGAKITPESFRAETGYGVDEQRRFVGMIARAENGGKSIERLAEELVSYDNAELGGITYGGDTNAARNAILDALQDAGTRGELAVDDTAGQDRYVEARRAELDARYMEAYGMTYEDYLAYEEQNLPEMLRKYANFDEVEFYNLYTDEIEQSLNARINEQGNDTAGEEPRTGGGNELLPGEGIDNARGSEGGTEQGTEVSVSVQGTVEDGAVPEETSAGNERELDFNGRLTRRRNLILQNLGDKYSLSDEEADNGELFYQNGNGSTTLAIIPDEIFDKLGLAPVPFKLTESMGWHVFDHHSKELKLKNISDAIDFVLSIINNVDTVRLGRDNSYIFSIENGRKKVGHRAVAIIVDSRTGEFMGIRTAGYESLKNIKERPLLWTRGTLAVSEDVATSPISTVEPQQDDEDTGRTKEQSNSPSSESKDTQTSANEQTVGEKIAQEEAKVEQNPTEAQKEAGNYKKGHIKIDGYDVTIENPKGSVRSGVDRNGQEWSVTMNNTYGYIRGTEGVDGDHIDVFLSDDPTHGDVYVIDQVNEDGSFDEHKVMYGFKSALAAKRAYLANYSPGWKGLGTITRVSKEEFKKWINSSHRKTKPFAEYKSVNNDGAQNEGNRALSFVDLKDRALKVPGVTVFEGTTATNGERCIKVGNKNSTTTYWFSDFAGDNATVELRTDRKILAQLEKKHDENVRLSKVKTANDFWEYLKSIGEADPKRGTAGYDIQTYIKQAKQDLVNEQYLRDVTIPVVEFIANENNNEVGRTESNERTDTYENRPLSLTDMREVEPQLQPQQVDIDGLTDDLRKNGEARLSDHFVIGGPGLTEKVTKKQPDNTAQEAEQQPAQEENQYGASNKLVSRERYEELKKRMRQKLGGQLNVGIDPEILAIGTEMAAYHIEAGARKFADYARHMIDDLGDAIRPYLKSFYNGARDLPEVLEAGLADEMTPYDEVRTFDTANFDKPTVNAIETARTVVQEQEVNKQAEEAKNILTTQRNEKERQKRSRNKKKSVSSQQTPDLFGNVNAEQNQEDDNYGLQRNDGAVRAEGLPTDRGDTEEPSGSMGETVGQESGRPDRSGEESGSGELRRSLQQSERLDGHLTPRNRNNNHVERGTDYAPTTPKARYDANVEAVRLAKELTDSGQQATDEQKAVLRQFSGWGGLGTFFNNERTRNELIALLGDDGYQQAAMSINSAYYTPADVIDAMWDIVKNLGFNGGNILEGSAGIGNILGLMPMDISDRSNIEAVEIDGVSGMILKLLYPDAKVDIQGFENTQVRNGSVDLAITNVPFVTGLHVHDTTGDRDLSRRFGNIHDFCIAKNVRKLREGGIGVFISSSGTLDKNKALREWVVNEGNADFIGAFRLNNKTFGGTTATSDIIVVRKRVNGNKSAGAIDLLDTESVRTVNVPVNDNGREKIKPVVLQYNKYFVGHPENMGGEMALNYERGETFRPEGSGLFPTNGINQRERMQQWAEKFKDKAVDVPQPQTEEPADTQTDANGNEIKDGTLVVGNDGSINVMYLGRQEPLGVNDKKVKGHTKAECVEDYNRIKRALNAVLEYETTNEKDDGLKPLLKELNDAYDSFKDKYGNLNKNTAISFLRNDIDFPSIQALEKFNETNDKDGKRIVQTEKTSIFTERVVQKEVEPHPTNVLDAVKASVFKTGRIDIPYIAKQLGMNHNEVNDAIVKGGYGFVDPATQTMEVSYEYLSGNVRRKLAIAEANNEGGRYDDNIKALRKVMPMDIPAHLIEFTFGSSWVNPKLFSDYVNEKTGVPVTLTNVGGQWNMDLPYYVATEKNKSEGVRSEKLNKIVLGTDLMNAAINNRTITVSTTQRTWDGRTETITDKEATQACAAKIDDIRNDFKDWARAKMQSDPEMAKEIEQVYNERFNNYVPKTVTEEFMPDHFPGATKMINLYPHQKKAVIRATSQPLMLAHEVGTGKTFTLITTAMEMRRLGLARKPMIVVQNATVGQFVASAKELYPNAKVLTIADNERNEEGRKRFYAKIKYNDWDMIVVPQSVFERIPDSEERQMEFINDRIEEKEHVLEQIQEIDPKSMIARNAKRELDSLQTELAEVSDKKRQKDEKRAAKTRQNAAAKAQEQLDRATDDVENFDDMEIDAVLVDEAHEYKHLGFSTAMQRGVKGVDPSYSKKSAGVYLKTRAVMEKSNGKNVVFATGTPISNTAAEIWTFMRYLMPKHTMEEYGIYYFDDFVRNFGNLTQMLEFTTSGKFRENNRFSGYVNIPELIRIWSSVSDTVLTKETNLKDKLPETVDGGQKATDIYLPQSASLRSIMKAVRAELERFDNMSGKEKKENSAIPLVMYGIAKAAAIDPRLVMAEAVDEPVSKTNRAVEETLKSLEATKDYKGTVAIFCDTYQNNQTGFNIYEEIKRKLVERGVPENQIVIMRSGMSVNKKAEIFDKVNAGDVRVIMGSTFTLGTGVNIQERLNTLIHLDAPNRPMDYTQRNGRILRQGNLHKEWGIPVKILRFGVEDSLDITAYQRLKTKGAIADSVMEGKKFINNNQQDRTLEEQEDVFGDTVAQLSGSEYALLKNQAERDFRKYNNKKKQYDADQIYVHNAIPRYEGQIKRSEGTIKQQQKALTAVEKAFPDGTVQEITIGNSKLSGQKAIGDYIKDVVNKKQTETEDKVRKGAQGTKASSSFTIKAGPFTFTVNTEYSKDTEYQNGSFFPVVHRNMTYSCEELGLSNVPVQRASFKNAVDDIMNNVLSGNDMRERIETENNSIERNRSELEQLKSREGKPFENEKELEDARKKVEEYTEKMRKEMEAKEQKYAEMDAQTQSADLGSLGGAEEAEEEELQRSGDGALTDDELSLANDPAAALTGRSTRTTAQRRRFAERERQRMVDAVQKLARKLNLDNVDIVTDASTLQGRRARAKGFYSRSTGRITIVIPNHTDIRDVEQTLLHEAVAHYGLRQLFGEHFDTFLDNVYNNVDPELKQRIDAMSQRHGWSTRTATEEYLASLAENTNFEDSMTTGWWSKIKQMFLAMLHKIGFEGFTGVTLSDNELRYILWRSYENLAEPGRYRSIIGEVRDIAKQHELGVGNYAPTDSKDRAADILGEPRIEEADRQFNEELDGLTEENADKVILSLGRPSAVLRAAGVEDKPMKLYGNKVIKKMKKHGFTLNELHNLPQAVANPIAVFNNYQKDGNRSVLTELQVGDKHILVSITIGKNGVDADFNIVSSVFGKGGTNIVDWINKGYATYINKKKALDYLHFSERRISEALNNQEGEKDLAWLSSASQPVQQEIDKQDLVSAANIVRNFENPSVEGEKIDDDVLYREAEEAEKDLNHKWQDEYDRRTLSAAFKFTEAAQDGMKSVSILQDVISKETDKPIKEDENVWALQNRLSSTNKYEQDYYYENYYKPLMRAVGNLVKAGARYDELGRNMEEAQDDILKYLISKHGIERNAHFREVAAMEARRPYDGSIEEIRKAVEEGAIAQEDADKQIDKLTEQANEAEEKSRIDTMTRDYSGLSELYNNKMDFDALAEQYVSDFESKFDTADLWNKINAATKTTLRKTYEAGLISRSGYEATRDMYQYYIPLRGWSNDVASRMGNH